jgi:ribonucleoside-diphosphate reductase alpha chain
MYVDSYGYKNTLGGLSHMFNQQMKIYDNIITHLLRENTPLNVVLDAIDKMEINPKEHTIDWKEGIKNALKLNPPN